MYLVTKLKKLNVYTGCPKIRGTTQWGNVKLHMLENYEKNIKKIPCLLDLKIWGLKKSSFDLIYFK
jgi:hypothetical protein